MIAVVNFPSKGFLSPTMDLVEFFKKHQVTTDHETGGLLWRIGIDFKIGTALPEKENFEAAIEAARRRFDAYLIILENQLNDIKEFSLVGLEEKKTS